MLIDRLARSPAVLCGSWARERYGSAGLHPALFAGARDPDRRPEFGHYSVARLCGVKVLRFSVGFGKPLLLRRFGADQTEWVLSAFPLGAT
jgi:hypothetical protein